MTNLPRGSDRALERRLDLIPTICSLAVFCVAGSFLLIWLVKPEWKSFSASTMKANTATALTLSAAALWLRVANYRRPSPGKRRIALALAVIVLLIGLLTCAEYALGWNFGIDEVLVADFLNEESRLFPGRMSPIAAVCFAFLGGGQLALNGSSKWGARAGALLVGLLFVVSLLSTVGYVFDVRDFYQLGKFIRIAWQAAVCLLVLAVGLFFSRPSPISVLTSAGPGGTTARRLAAVAVFFPVAIGWAALFGSRQGYFEADFEASLVAVAVACVFCALTLATAVKLDRVDVERLGALSQFRTLADSIPQHAWIADPNGEIRWFNRRWYEYTGASETPQDPLAWQRFHEPAELQRYLPGYQKAVASGEPWEDTFPVRGKDGALRWFLARALPVRDETGTIVRWFGTNTDVEDQRAARLERERLVEELQASVAKRDEFITVAAHELRTPLTALQLQVHGLLLLLRQEPPERVNPKVLKKAETASQQVARLGTLIEGLLNVSNVSVGKLVLEPAEADLNELVRSSVARFDAQATAARCTLEVRSPGPLLGQWDLMRLEQVLTNLISNAIKYSPASRIEVAVEEAQGWAMVKVSDRGIGIAPADQARIFGRYERANSVKNYGGLGLGLYVSREIVEAHGGSIEVESTLGVGSVFVVKLPMRPPSKA